MAAELGQQMTPDVVLGRYKVRKPLDSVLVRQKLAASLTPHRRHQNASSVVCYSNKID